MTKHRNRGADDVVAFARGVVGRADLLRALHAARSNDESDKALIASNLGFAWPQVEVPVELPSVRTRGRRRQASPPAYEPLQGSMLGVAVQPETEAPPSAPDVVQPVDRAPLSRADWLGVDQQTGGLPEMPAIVPRRRLAVAIRQATTAAVPAGIDVNRMVQCLAQRHWPAVPPRHWRRQQAGQVVVVIDLDGPTSCYRADFQWLIGVLRTELGPHRVQVRVLVDGLRPLAGWRHYARSADESRPSAAGDRGVTPLQWSALHKSTHVLVLSDLGLSSTDRPWVAEAWTRWLAVVSAQGCRMQAWSPVPVRACGVAQSLARLAVVHWSAGSTLRPTAAARGAGHVTPQRLALSERLVSQLSCCEWIDVGLIRRLRIAMGQAALDAGLEQLVWDSPDLEGNVLSRRIRPPRVAALRDSLDVSEPDLRRAHQNVVAYYEQFSQPLVHMHVSAATARPGGRRVVSDAQVHAAQRFVEQLSLRPEQAGIPVHEVRLFLLSWLTHADPQEHVVHANRDVALTRALAQVDRRSLLDYPIPDGARHGDMARHVPGLEPAWRGRLVLDTVSGAVLLDSDRSTTGHVPLSAEVIECSSADLQSAPDAPRRWLLLAGGGPVEIARQTITSPVRLRTATATYVVAPIARPPGVASWYRARDGLYVEGQPLGTRVLRAHSGVLELLAPAESTSDTRLQLRVPPLVTDVPGQQFGIDEFGLWAELTLAGVVQRFRWIEPGVFLMGSPKGEAERYDDEGPQHEVRLSQGYWLGDSACTQALWQAVMGDNPSHFKGEQDLPVEKVSWKDVQRLLDGVQSQLPEGVEAMLPTEAQWEYACRAGTTTPFSMGEQINPAQVNYDGRYPYVGGAEGECRKRPVPVKSLPPNAWGLYEMHGNVLEWCADGMRKYTKAAQQDPVGPGGAVRVVRGGAWSDFGGLCRSAYRRAAPPGDAFHSLGFRLALRSRARPGPTEAAERPTDAEAGGARPTGPAEPGPRR